MKLQIKDSGAWRNLFSVTDQQRPHVLAAAASLLTALNQPQTVMRLVENDVVLDSCAGPAFRWSGQSACTCPSGDGSLSWPCPSHALPATVPPNWMQFVEACAECDSCTINFGAIARRAKSLLDGIDAAPAAQGDAKGVELTDNQILRMAMKYSTATKFGREFDEDTCVEFARVVIATSKVGA